MPDILRSNQNYGVAGHRLYADGHCLYQARRFATASHLFGLAAECALKAFMDSIPGGDRKIPYKHLPELLDDAKLWLQGRKRAHLGQVISHPDYMHGWAIDNRYWPDELFNEEDCARFRHDARQALQAIPGAL